MAETLCGMFRSRIVYFTTQKAQKSWSKAIDWTTPGPTLYTSDTFNISSENNTTRVSVLGGIIWELEGDIILHL